MKKMNSLTLNGTTYDRFAGDVESVNGQTGNVVLNAEDVGALPDTTPIPTVPAALPNPHKLTFTGAVSAEYDGSAAVSVEIPDASDIELDTTLSVEGKAADAKAVGDRLLALENNTPAEGGSGLTVAQVNALDGMFKIATYTADATDAYTAFKTAFGISDSGGGEEEPDEPVTPEVTLTSISATYSGGDVVVGTAVSDLTDIAVTAHYSDGSTATVTDYTLSGEIADGSNTITVSYGGKTTTFAVTGVAESSGGDSDTTAVVNLFDKDTMAVSGAFVGSNGVLSTSATSKYAKIPISVGTYALQKGSGWGMSTTGHPALIDANGNVLCRFGNLQASGTGGSPSDASIGTIAKANGNAGIAVTVLSDAVTHIIFSICVNGGTDDTDTTMMEVGDTCHDYVAYE